MREIKFRGWEKHAKRMAEVTAFKWQPDHLYHQIYTRAIVNEKMFDEWYAYDFGGDSNGIILMQYTGLNDKNGVEIYEGDMVKLIDSNNKILECTVEYITGSFWYVIQHNQLTIGVWEYHNFINKSVEVIGNIHENKELLEEIK